MGSMLDACLAITSICMQGQAFWLLHLERIRVNRNRPCHNDYLSPDRSPTFGWASLRLNAAGLCGAHSRACTDCRLNLAIPHSGRAVYLVHALYIGLCTSPCNERQVFAENDLLQGSRQLGQLIDAQK